MQIISTHCKLKLLMLGGYETVAAAWLRSQKSHPHSSGQVVMMECNSFCGWLVNNQWSCYPTETFTHGKKNQIVWSDLPSDLSSVQVREFQTMYRYVTRAECRNNVDISRRSCKAYHMPSYWGWTWKTLHLRIAPKPNINMHIHAIVSKNAILNVSIEMLNPNSVSSYLNQ